MLPYEDGLNERFWSKGVREPLEKDHSIAIYSLSNLIDKNTYVSSAGSCFAQNIGKNLLNKNYSFLQSKHCTNPFQSFGLGNIYTTRQLYQWLEFCFGKRTWSKHTFFEDQEGQFLDYLNPKNDPVSSLKALNDNRNDVALEFVSTLKKSDVFIFTCGLTECCKTLNDEVLAIAPGTLFGSYDSNTHYFINLYYQEIIDDLKKIEREITQINPDIKFIYTVSPVPLTATSTSEHVLIANNYSKSTLRAAVGDHVKSSQNSFYFPSYELITHNTLGDWRFEKNLRSVSEEGLKFVMHHGFDEIKERENVSSQKVELKEKQEIQCEEEKLETFSRIKKSVSNNTELILIGDSHFGKYARFLDKSGVSYHGGQIMNGSGFSDNKFSLDSEKIFCPEEDDNSSYIWENTFKALKDLGGKSTIYTNIGFQTHRTIPFILNHFKIPFLSEKHVSEYFSKFYTNTLTILSQLGNFGSVTLVEDPNIYLLLDEKECPAGTQTKLLRINFPIYTSYIRRLCKLLNYDYLAPFELVIPDVFGQTSDISSLVGDDFIHSSDIFYEKFADYIYQKTDNKKFAK